VIRGFTLSVTKSSCKWVLGSSQEVWEVMIRGTFVRGAHTLQNAPFGLALLCEN